ncbi:E3 ubiquitin-protein ligase [Acrasis kona]|uniref:E3 ubiquitin-protein ligase n=1 Tax=Acrasis kona TaxID=1008807 RepID=A0AAW2ZKD9_9EUKA
MMNEEHEKQCRICLESNGHLITPCKCSGTMGYVHNECMAFWVQHKTAYNGEKNEFQCDTCRYKMKYESIDSDTATLTKQIVAWVLTAVWTSAMIMIGYILVTSIGLYISGQTCNKSALKYWGANIPWSKNFSAQQLLDNLFMSLVILCPNALRSRLSFLVRVVISFVVALTLVLIVSSSTDGNTSLTDIISYILFKSGVLSILLLMVFFNMAVCLFAFWHVMVHDWSCRVSSAVQKRDCFDALKCLYDLPLQTSIKFLPYSSVSCA